MLRSFNNFFREGYIQLMENGGLGLGASAPYIKPCVMILITWEKVCFNSI